ncbi:MAG TPA: FAD-binding oxidoreductase [Burkholderiales bacterium]|nr:FAD-binding oxidoreductase [Burkholderiales bacterium]
MDDGANVRTRLVAAVGAANVLTEPSATAPYLTDWRGRFHGHALAVVRPGNAEEVAAVVRLCRDAQVPIVAQGGNTGMCGGATPDAAGHAILLSLGRLNRIRAIDRDNATITVESGVILAQVQQAAAEAGLHFPLSLGSEGSCTIGGNLSTNAGGTAVLRFGNARELVLGLEVVLADGRIWDGLRGLRKDNTGYDLKQLFVGAEGTLGIITAAVLKLFPQPLARVTALAAVASPESAVALLRGLKRALSDRLVGFELISGLALNLCRKHHPDLPDPLPGHAWYALVQVDDSSTMSALNDIVENAFGQAVEDASAMDVAIAQSQDQAQALWALRENISESQRREGPNIKHDISLPVSAIPEFLHASERALSAAFPGAQFVIFGHLGDGNLHYNLAAPAGTDARAFMDNAPQANRIVHDLVTQRGGSISAEHGIGQLKREELKRYKAPVELELMRAIKNALDPAGLLNPGKVL